MLSWLFSKRDKMSNFTETQAVQQYINYQNSVMTNDKALTFLEWIITNKIVLLDVPAAEFAEILS